MRRGYDIPPGDLIGPSGALDAGGQLSRLFGGRCPAGQQLEAVGRRRSRGCGVSQHRQSRVSRELHRLEIKIEPADDRMAEALAAGPVEPDVMGGPALAEVLAPGRKLADQLDELLVIRVTAGLRSEHGGDVIGGALPVGEELTGGRVQIDEARAVGWPARVGKDRGVERTREPVGGEYVVPGVAHPGRRIGEGVEDLMNAVGDTGNLASPLPRRRRLSRPG